MQAYIMDDLGNLLLSFFIFLDMLHMNSTRQKFQHDCLIQCRFITKYHFHLIFYCFSLDHLKLIFFCFCGSAGFCFPIVNSISSTQFLTILSQIFDFCFQQFVFHLFSIFEAFCFEFSILISLMFFVIKQKVFLFYPIIYFYICTKFSTQQTGNNQRLSSHNTVVL